MRGRFADNPAYVEYERLLKELHALIAAGDGQGPKAEAIRDAMDAPSSHLNRAEIIRLKGLSADLYMLQGKEVLSAGRRLGLHELESELSHFRQWNSWDAVLGLLRQRSSDVPDALVAVTRARAYAELGHADTALLFLDYAFNANPEDPDYRALRLMLLLDAGRHDEATRAAETILLSKGASPNLVFAAADVLFASAVAQPQQGLADAGYRRVLEILDRLLFGGQATTRLLPSFLVMAHLLRAACLSHFGRNEEALRACDEALQIAPNDQVILQVRSFIQGDSADRNLKTVMSSALDRFKRSVWARPVLSAA
jgi:tetratricopeptide (TPR) repeat protein